MKLLISLVLVFSSYFSFAHILSADFLSNAFEFKSGVSLFMSESFSNIPTLGNLESISVFNTTGKKLDFDQEIIVLQSQSKSFYSLYFLFLFSSVFGVWFYFKKREKRYFDENQKLLLEIETLKKELAVRSVSSPLRDKKLQALDKTKIEKAINGKLGESSWMILNLIFSNPSISNKELAKEVSLSLEGVSSSLRRMYQAFEIPASSNKKITLIMKATRLSLEK